MTNDSIIKINAATTDSDIREMVELASAAERLATYNRMTGKATKKFASAAQGIKQTVAALIAERDRLVAEGGDEDGEIESRNVSMYGVAWFPCCPYCGNHLSNGVITKGDLPGQDADMTHKFECMACGGNFGPELSKARANGVAESWKNPEVAAKRAQRNAVEVDGVQYRSVRAAYLALELPLKEHIQFRMLLKENGQLENYGRVWKIVPRG